MGAERHCNHHRAMYHSGLRRERKRRWDFKLIEGTQTTVGIVSSAFNPETDENMNKTAHGWGFYQGDGKLAHGGSAGKAYAPSYKGKSTVSVEIDFGAKTLRFYVDDKDM